VLDENHTRRGREFVFFCFGGGVLGGGGGGGGEKAHLS